VNRPNPPVPDRRYGPTPATAPGPTGPSMLAQAGAISTDPLAFLQRMSQRYGPVVQFPLPRPATYFVDDPTAIRQVLIGGSGFDKDTPQYRALALVTGAGLLAALDEQWRAQRPVVQPAFHASAAARLVDDTRDATGRLVTRWEQVPAGAVVDLQDAMLGLALDAILGHLFGCDSPTPGAARRLGATLQGVVDSLVFPQAALRRLPTPERRRHRARMRELESAVAGIIAARRDAPPARHANLLDLLLAAYPRDERAVRDQVVTFLVAGHETLAAALTWTFGLLAHHGAEQEWAAAQAGDARTRAVDACLCEALRLYPPAWVISRTAHEPTELAGRAIPRGALLIISPWVRHRDEGVWAHPEAFDPARFGDQPVTRARTLTLRGDYLPFGAGRRLCVGRDMALLQGREVVSMLLARFRFDPAEPALPRASARVTLRPATGLRVRIRPRER
jgi:cytochrome P450